MRTKKKILVIGAGAIGGYVGGSLAHAGFDVVFLCRPETALRIRTEGFHLHTPEGRHLAPVTVVESVREAFAAGAFDAIILAVKRYDTADAVTGLSDFTSALPPIINLQNGIGAEEELEALLGPVDVIPGTVTTAVGRPKPNQVVVERLRGIGLAGPHPHAGRWVEEFSDAGLQAAYYDNAKSMKWSKLITNLIANPSSAILDLTPAEIFSDRGLFGMEMLQLREALTVMKKSGVDVVDLPGTPVRLLAFCVQYLPQFIAQPLLGRALGKGRGGKMPSFYGDLHSGRGRSEIGYLHGAVVREGARLGVPTPVNQLLVSTLQSLLDGTSDTAAFRRKPETILSHLA